MQQFLPTENEGLRTADDILQDNEVYYCTILDVADTLEAANELSALKDTIWKNALN